METDRVGYRWTLKISLSAMITQGGDNEACSKTRPLVYPGFFSVDTSPTDDCRCCQDEESVCCSDTQLHWADLCCSCESTSIPIRAVNANVHYDETNRTQPTMVQVLAASKQVIKPRRISETWGARCPLQQPNPRDFLDYPLQHLDVR